MNKLNLALSLAVLMPLAACSDNDEGVAENFSEHVIGTYDGYTSASSAYFSGMMNADQKITVAKGTIDNCVNIRYESGTWGTISATDVTVLKNEDTYVLTGSGVWAMGHNGNVNDYDCTVTANIKSGQSQFIFSSPAVMGGLKVEFNEGQIPASLVLPGNYDGWTDATCAYFPSMIADNQTITITNTGDVFSLNYESDTWGTFSFQDIDYTYDEGAFAISGNGTCKMGMDDNIKEYPCNLSGTVDVEKSAPSFIINVPAVMGGLTITFSPGDSPSESANE